MHSLQRNKAVYKIGWKTLGDINLPSSRLRAYIPINYLNKNGWDCEIYNQKNIARYNIVVFQKCYTEFDIELAHHLKERGIKIVFDQCDNHFYNPIQSSEFEDRINLLNQMVEIADLITVSTAELAKLFKNKKSVVVYDAVDIPRLSWQQRLKLYFKKSFFLSKKRVLKVVWFGSSGSECPRFGMIDILKVLPDLEKIHVDLMPIKLSVISNSKVLFDKYLENAKVNCVYYKWQRETVSYLIRQNDVTIIPVNLNPFTVVKSNNRVVASLMNNVPVIADCIPSYKEFKDFICFSEWQNNLVRYYTNEVLRKEHVEKGKSYIIEKYSEEKIRLGWEKVFYYLMS